MKQIGVIGANGYIGRHIVLMLSRKGHEPFLFDKDEQSIDGRDNYHKIDLRCFETFPKQLGNLDIIFFFAGKTSHALDRVNNLNMIEGNDIGLLNFLEFCRQNSCKAKIIFPSTRLIYKGQKNRALKETDPKEFKTVYAVSKYACEQYLIIYSMLTAIRYTIFRICVPYGNSIDESLSYGTIKHFIDKAKNGQDIALFGEGDQKRSFIHINDVSNLLIQGAFSEKTDNDIFNISGPDVLSIKQVAQMIAERYGVQVRKMPWPKMEQLIETGDTIFDSSKLNKILEYCYETNFFEWITKN